MSLFLPGFIYIQLYSWLNSKKNDITITTLWSLIISFIIKSFYSVIHSIVVTTYVFNDALKIIIYIITAILLSVLVAALKKWKCVAKFLKWLNDKTLNEDIFDDVLDYKKPCILQIYLKTSPKLYIGRFVLREEKGLDSWIVLSDYVQMNTNNMEEEYCPSDHKQKSMVALNLRDIERIEIIYDNNSEVWKRFNNGD